MTVELAATATSVTGGDIRSVAMMLFETLRAMNLSTSAIMLYMIRFIVMMMLLPVMAEQILNTMSRMGFAMVLAAFVALGQPWNEVVVLSGGEIALIVMKEIALGLALGFAMATPFWVIEYVGALIDTGAGFNSVQLQNPMTSEQSTPVSNFLGKLAGAVFFSVGGAIFMVQTMFDSYQVWPLTDLAPSAQGAYAVFIERQVGTMFSSVLKLAAPILIVVTLIDLGVGLLAKSAEKLEPASLAQPIKGVVSVLLVLLMVSAVFDQLRQHIVPRNVVQQLLPKAG